MKWQGRRKGDNLEDRRECHQVVKPSWVVD
jgi:hypothetical protein